MYIDFQYRSREGSREGELSTLCIHPGGPMTWRGSDWMRKTENRVLWRNLGEAYVQQWTAIEYRRPEEGKLGGTRFWKLKTVLWRNLGDASYFSTNYIKNIVICNIDYRSTSTKNIFCTRKITEAIAALLIYAPRSPTNSRKLDIIMKQYTVCLAWRYPRAIYRSLLCN